MSLCIQFYPRNPSSQMHMPMPDVADYLEKTHDAAFLNELDANICAHMHCDVHPVRYAFSWFDTIAFQLACGKSHDAIDLMLQETNKDGSTAWYYVPALREINRYIEAYYTTDQWTEIGKGR